MSVVDFGDVSDGFWMEYVMFTDFHVELDDVNVDLWLGRVFLNSNTKTAKIKLETPKFFTPSSPQLLLWHQFPEGLGVSSSNKNYQLPWYPIDWTWSGRQNLSCSGISAPYCQFVNNVGNHWRSLDNVYLIIALSPSQWTLDASYSP